MRLSEAIRLGAMLKPQAFGDLWRDGGRTSCALGAAYEALGFGPGSDVEDNEHVPRGIRDFLEEPSACPVCKRENRIGLTVTHLNDAHKWTRERIADWVATVEPAEPSDLHAIDQAELVTENAGRA